MTLISKLKNVKSQIGPSYPLRPELLLHGNIPAPMHGVAPRTVLGVNWWNRERNECYKKAEGFCQSCGVPKIRAAYHQWLEAHEVYDVDYAKGRMKYLYPVALCHFCHAYIHDGRLQALLDKGEIHHHKYVAIITHGDEVLRRAGLVRESRVEREAKIQKMIANGQLAEWSKWRLRIGRNLYKPLYASMEEWELAMAKKTVEDE